MPPLRLSGGSIPAIGQRPSNGIFAKATMLSWRSKMNGQTIMKIARSLRIYSPGHFYTRPSEKKQGIENAGSIPRQFSSQCNRIKLINRRWRQGRFASRRPGRRVTFLRPANGAIRESRPFSYPQHGVGVSTTHVRPARTTGAA